MKLCICLFVLAFCALVNGHIFDKPLDFFKESLVDIKHGFKLLKKHGKTWVEYAKNSTRRLKQDWNRRNLTDQDIEENKQIYSTETPIKWKATEVSKIEESLIREEIQELQEELFNITGIKKGIKAKIDDLMSVLHELKLNRTTNQIQ